MWKRFTRLVPPPQQKASLSFYRALDSCVNDWLLARWVVLFSRSVRALGLLTDLGGPVVGSAAGARPPARPLLPDALKRALFFRRNIRVTCFRRSSPSSLWLPQGRRTL